MTLLCQSVTMQEADQKIKIDRKLNDDSHRLPIENKTKKKHEKR